MCICDVPWNNITIDSMLMFCCENRFWAIDLKPYALLCCSIYPITFTTTLKRKELSNLLLIPIQSLKTFCLASNNAIIVWKWKIFGYKS